METFTAGVERGAVWSVVNWQELTSDRRIDAEYHQPKYLQLDKVLAGFRAKPWGDLEGDFIVGPFGSAFTVENYVESSQYQYIRGKDVKPFFLRHDDNAYMPKSDFERLAKYKVESGDLLVSVVGTLGNVAVVDDDVGLAIFSCKSTAYRPASVDPYYLCAYLNCTIGQAYLERKPRGALQTGLNLEDLRTTPILLPDPARQQAIGGIVKSSWAKFSQSETLYAEAEALLLAELGLGEWPQTSEVCQTSEVSASQAWAAGRLDAEYFQPRYYALLDRLQKTGEAVRLGDWLTEPINRGAQPNYDESGNVIVINSQHVGKTHVELEDNRHTTREFVEQNERAVVRRYDVLLNSTGYVTIGRCQTLLEDVDAIVDGHVSIVRPKQGIDPVYLGLFLNSLPGQMQTERNWTGSSGQIELRSELIENYTVWKPGLEFQKHIRELVEDAHVARCEAQRLLEEAKRRVEEMVLGNDTHQTSEV